MSDKWTPDNKFMPIKFESAKRINERFYKNWGIPEGKYKEESDELYIKEWTGGPLQMQRVADAAVHSGVGSFSFTLRNVCGTIAAYLIHEVVDDVKIIDVGAGGGRSIKAVYSQLPKEEWDKVYAFLIDPSEKNIMASKDFLEKTLGLKEGKHFDSVLGRDIDIPREVSADYFDIAIQVASIHHHAYLGPAFKAVAYALKKNGLRIETEKENGKYGGVFVSGDWHSRIWESPTFVYQWLLKRMDWPKKEEGIKSFIKQFPDALKELSRIGYFDLKNLEVFSHYWNTWNKDRQGLIIRGEFTPDQDFFAVEGHCPEWIYEEELKDAGFLLDTPLINKLIEEGLIDDNPHQTSPDHNLNMIVVGQQYKK